MVLDSQVFDEFLKGEGMGLSIPKFAGNDHDLKKRVQTHMKQDLPCRGSVSEIRKQAETIEGLESREHFFGAGEEPAVVQERREIGIDRESYTTVVGRDAVVLFFEGIADPKGIVGFSAVLTALFNVAYRSPAMSPFEGIRIKIEAGL